MRHKKSTIKLAGADAMERMYSPPHLMWLAAKCTPLYAMQSVLFLPCRCNVASGAFKELCIRFLPTTVVYHDHRRRVPCLQGRWPFINHAPFLLSFA